MIEPSPERLSAFLDERDRRLISEVPRMPDRTRAIVARDWGGKCAFCESAGMTLARLIPHHAGGISRIPNLVLACRACHKRRGQGNWDALELAHVDARPLSAAAATQRLEALALCPQHPVPPDARRSLADCRKYLSETRWLHPRVPMLVSTSGERVLLAVLQVPAGDAAATLLAEIREAGGRSEGAGVWSVAVAEWTHVASSLIDRHAVLFTAESSTDRSDLCVPTAPPSWRSSWHVLFSNLSDTRRNQTRKPIQGFKASAKAAAWRSSQRFTG